MNGIWDGHALSTMSELVGMKLNLTRIEENDDAVELNGDLFILAATEYVHIAQVSFTMSNEKNHTGVMHIRFHPQSSSSSISCSLSVVRTGTMFATSNEATLLLSNSHLPKSKQAYQCTLSIFSTSLSSTSSLASNQVVSHSNNAFTLSVFDHGDTGASLPSMFTTFSFLQRVKDVEKTFVQKYGPYLAISVLVLVRI